MKKKKVEYTSNSIKIKYKNTDILLYPFSIMRKQLYIDVVRANYTFIEKLAEEFDFCSLIIERCRLIVFLGDFCSSTAKHVCTIKTMRENAKAISNTFLLNGLKVQAISPYSLKSYLNKKTKKLNGKCAQIVKDGQITFNEFLGFTELSVNKDVPNEILEGIIELRGVKLSFTFAKKDGKVKAFGMIRISGKSMSEVAQLQKSIFRLLNLSKSITGRTAYVSEKFIKNNPARLLLGYGEKSIDRKPVVTLIANISLKIKYKEKKNKKISTRENL